MTRCRDEIYKNTIQKARGINADSEETGEDIKLRIHVCNALHNREWLQMKGITKKIWKLAHNLYEIQ